MTIICPACSWEREAPAVPDEADVCMNCGLASTPTPLSAGPLPATVPVPAAMPYQGLLAVETCVLPDVARCVKCTARRHPEDGHCRFCGNPFESPEASAAPVPAASPTASRRRFAWIGLSIALVLVSVVLLRPAKKPEVVRVITPEERCAGNLHLLREAVKKLQAAGQRMPSSVGSEFWKDLAALPSASPALRCPLDGSRYRGPARPWDQLEDDAVILADMEGGHPGGGTVLYKNGTVRPVAKGSPLYRLVLDATRE